jgi:hypothetical protein
MIPSRQSNTRLTALRSLERGEFRIGLELEGVRTPVGRFGGARAVDNQAIYIRRVLLLSLGMGTGPRGKGK